jgi:hypothetical protein
VGKNIFSQFKGWLWDARAYELTDDFFFILSDGQTVYIPKGFRTDFASSPRMLWPLGMDPVGVLLIPSLIHDFGYRHGFYLEGSGKRIVATTLWEKGDHDHLFREISDDVNDFKAPGWLAVAALGIFGWPAWWSALKRRTGRIDLIGEYA